MTTRTPLGFSNYYHLYNHANGDIQLFRNEENYRYFLSRYEKYVHPLVETLSYCLLPNHFHFLIKVKDQVDLPEFLLKNNASNSIISNSIKNWLLSYTQAYNRAYNIKGNLFHQKIRRKEVSDEKYLQSLIAYINLNPIHHNFVSKSELWRYSSYQALITDKRTLINRELVFAFFDDLENLKYYLDSKKLDYILEQVKIEY